MSMRRPAAPELSEAARARLDALRRDLLEESRGHEHAVVPHEPREADEPHLSAASPVTAEPVMPLPGRHAVRRARPTPPWLEAVADRLPAGLGDRPLGLAHVAVLAVATAVLVVAGAWWALQVQTDVAPAPRPPAAAADPERAAGSGQRSATGPSSAPDALVELPSSGSTGAARAGTNALSVVVVDVAGKVRRPGLATLPEGARVADAVEAAGGPRRGVRLTSLNLARVLVDGEQVLVGVPSTAGATATAGGPVGAGPGGTPEAGQGAVLVNLNTVDAAGLEALPGVGPVTAAAILAWRDEHGGFRAVTELLEVSGIGPATLEDLTPLVTV